MESKSNGRAGRCRVGDVLVRWKGLPPADGVDAGLAAVVAVEIGGGVAREWPDGVLVQCPLTLAGALHDARDAAPDLGLQAALLDELDRQYEPSCDEEIAARDEEFLDGVGEAVCGGEAPEGSFFRSEP